jgi:hypothetical protein
MYAILFLCKLTSSYEYKQKVVAITPMKGVPELVLQCSLLSKEVHCMPLDGSTA